MISFIGSENVSYYHSKVKDSPDQSHFIFEINVGISRIHLSDIDSKNKMAWVPTTLNWT